MFQPWKFHDKTMKLHHLSYQLNAFHRVSFKSLSNFRQLQMAAISRNTQAVAQDFHNAGGGKTMEIQYTENSMKKLHFNELNGQKVIRKSSVKHSIDCNRNANTEKTKMMVPNQRSTMGPIISPPANQKQMSNQSLGQPNAFDCEHENKENDLVLYGNFGKDSFDLMSLHTIAIDTVDGVQQMNPNY